MDRWWVALAVGCGGGDLPAGPDTGAVGETAAPAADASAPDTSGPADGDPPNALIVILDDVGVDRVGVYGAAEARTPTLDALAVDGVWFERAFTAPTCSPSRALLLTGRYGRRTGIGRTVRASGDGAILDPAEVGLPEVLARAPVPYAAAAVGKWHLGRYGTDADLAHPAGFGFERWSVVMGNPGGRGTSVLPFESWWAFEENVNGSLEATFAYATTDQVDDALAAVQTLPEPWVVWLALSAAHEPLHVPPDGLHTTSVTATSPDPDLFDAVLEAADTELGRLLDGLRPAVRDRTNVVVIGDNGTPHAAVRPPVDPLRVKATLFEGGVRVPWIAQGPDVTARGPVPGLVHAVDLLPTLATLGGVPEASWPEVDGRSLAPMLSDASAPGRDHVYLETFAPNGIGVDRVSGVRSVRDATHRYLRALDGTEALYRLGGTDQRDDGDDLLAHPLSREDADALARLRALVDGYARRLGP